jgi:hypothetical protein
MACSVQHKTYEWSSGRLPSLFQQRLPQSIRRRRIQLHYVVGGREKCHCVSTTSSMANPPQHVNRSHCHCFLSATGQGNQVKNPRIYIYIYKWGRRGRGGLGPRKNTCYNTAFAIERRALPVNGCIAVRPGRVTQMPGTTLISSTG